MTAKEALENIKRSLTRVNDTTDELFIVEDKEIKCLKSALNRLDELEKVLKIIKEKNVDLRPFKEEFVEQNNDYRFYLENYDYYHYGDYEILTENEFNLLKEYFK